MTGLVNVLDKVTGFVTRIAKFIVGFSVAAQVIVVFFAVVFRYFIKSPLTWGDEISSFLLVFITFFGCYVGLVENRLAKIELFVGLFKGVKKRVLYIISEIFSLSLLCIIFYLSVGLFFSPTVQGQTSTGLFIPMSILYGLIPVTFSFSIIYSLTRLIKLITQKEE